jgi:hypothetical protein
MSKPREKVKVAPRKATTKPVLPKAREPENANSSETSKVARQLEERFGLGSQPELRRRLFQRLQLATEVHGERALNQLKIVAAEAKGARKPDRYFCRAALCRLREQNLLEMEELG